MALSNFSPFEYTLPNFAVYPLSEERGVESIALKTFSAISMALSPLILITPIPETLLPVATAAIVLLIFFNLLNKKHFYVK